MMIAATALSGCETTTSGSVRTEIVGAYAPTPVPATATGAVPATKSASATPPVAAVPVDFPQLTCAAYHYRENKADRLTATRVRKGDPYYIEFRERDAIFIGSGHTYVVFGALDENGNPVTRQYIGLFPRGDAVGFTAGAVVPVPAQLTPEERDCTANPNVAYRVSLTSAQYAQLLAKVRAKLANPPLWSMVAYNCNQFAAELGEVAGLKTPFSIMVPANPFLHAYINANERRS